MNHNPHYWQFKNGTMARVSLANTVLFLLWEVDFAWAWDRSLGAFVFYQVG